MTTDWAYVAGFFDGEGTAAFQRDSKGAQRWPQLTIPNTSLEVLEYIQSVAGCGTIKPIAKSTLGKKDIWQWSVWHSTDVARVARSLLQYSIIKRAVLEKAVALADLSAPAANRGTLAEVGVEGIRKMYDEQGLSQGEIATVIGVTPTAVSKFMRTRGIAIRSTSENWARIKADGAKMSRMFSAERNLKISNSKRAYHARSVLEV